MDKLIRHADGACHFSDLKKFAESSLHYRDSCENPCEPSASMRIGTIAHAMVLGGKIEGRPLVRYEGKVRNGKVWDQFEKDHAAEEIVTVSEWQRAELVANAILRDRIAQKRMVGARREVALRWKMGAIECSTDGIDLVGRTYIGEVKTTTCANPERFWRQVYNMHYHAQAAFYLAAARANGLDVSEGFFLIAAETKRPYPVVVYHMPEDVLLDGEKSVTLWLEKLRACDETNNWPGYAQEEVELSRAPWLDEDGDAIELDDEENAA